MSQIKEFGHISPWRYLPLPSAHIWEHIGFCGSPLCLFWLFPYMRRLKEEEREINDLLTMMELPEEIKLRKAHELSGGQQKRVCIARALAAQPDVLIFDEAVSGLDVLVRKHILDLLKRLHQERKMTCFFITHDLDVALYLADRVMVMRCGKIIEDRTFHGSTDCFTHPYTKLLLHSIAPYLG